MAGRGVTLSEAKGACSSSWPLRFAQGDSEQSDSERRGSERGDSNDPPVHPDPHRAQPHVEIRERDHEQTAPGPAQVRPVEATRTGVELAPHWSPGEPVEISADHVAHRMAAQGI